MLRLKAMLCEIKVGRLVLAIAVTVLVADTVPHPHLSTGFLATSIAQAQKALADMPDLPRVLVAESSATQP